MPAAKLREMIGLGSAAIEEPWDAGKGTACGLEVGATGPMTGACLPCSAMKIGNAVL